MVSVGWNETVGVSAAMVSIYFAIKSGLPLDDLLLIVVVSALIVSFGMRKMSVAMPVPS